MLVVVDTNVMISALARRSPLAPLFRAIAKGELRLAITSAIVFEYEEIAVERGGPAFAAKLMHWLSLVSASWGTIEQIHPSYQFQVIIADPDDNKFVDYAITANADFIITRDANYAPLAGSGYKTQPITPEEFIARHLLA